MVLYLSRWQLYLLLTLPIVYLILFDYIPMAGAQIAFRKFDFRYGIWHSPWVGFENFRRFFNSYQFWDILYNTLFLSVYGLAVSFPLPIILALLLNSFPGVRFKKVVQTVSYIPHFISTVVVVGMLMQIFNPRTGAVGNIYSLFTGGIMKDIFASPSAFPHLYVWTGVWQSTGWSSVIYFAALAGISPELHEAAKVDGATKLQLIRHIDLPLIMPTATILLIMNCGSILSVGFEKAFLLQNNLNASVSEIISTYVYKVGLINNDMSYSSAIGLFNTIVNMVMLIIVNTISDKLSGNSLW